MMKIRGLFVYVMLLCFLLSCGSSLDTKVSQHDSDLAGDTIIPETIVVSDTILATPPSIKEDIDKGVSAPWDSLPADKKLVMLAKDFREKLAQGKKLYSLFSNRWILVYHAYFRGDGSTDGSLENLSISQIDTPVKIPVLNDGKGWEEGKKASTYFMDFLLREKIEDWDRVKISEYEKKNNIFYVVGAGESDFVKVHCAMVFDRFRIVKLEYHSVDPG